MVGRWAHVTDGVVTNVSLWDGDTDAWTPPDDCLMVPITDENVGPGDLYDGQTFTRVEAPTPVTVPVDVDPDQIAALLTAAEQATTVAQTRTVLTDLLRQLTG